MKNLHLNSSRFSYPYVELSESILMAKAKQNLNVKIEMLVGKEAKTLFEVLFKNPPSLVVVAVKRLTT